MITTIEKETRKGGESIRCEGEGVVILKRVVRKGFGGMVAFGQGPEERKEQALQVSRGRTFQAEGQASAKTLR